MKDWTGLEMALGLCEPVALPVLARDDFDDQGLRNERAAFLDSDYHKARKIVSTLGWEVPAYEKRFSLISYSKLFADLIKVKEALVSAQARCRTVLHLIFSEVIQGNISVVVRPRLGGATESAPPEWFQVDSYIDRIYPCAINPSKPFDDGAEKTHWFFFEDAGVRSYCDRFTRTPPAHEFQGYLSPYIRVMIEATKRASLGPSLEEQLEKGVIQNHVAKVAKDWGLKFSEGEIADMAQLMREPMMRGRSLKEARKNARTQKADSDQ